MSTFYLQPHPRNIKGWFSHVRSRHFSGWVAWQNKFNEKEKTEKRQFADDFKKKLETKQAEIQHLINTSNQDL